MFLSEELCLFIIVEEEAVEAETAMRLRWDWTLCWLTTAAPHK